MRTRNYLAGLLSAVSLFLVGMSPSTAMAQNSVRPGEFYVEPTTQINAGFEWYITGDDNRTASVTVWYRQANGNSHWQQGMNLIRIQNEVAFDPPYYVYVAPNMFAGSIFDLQPGTEYVAKFEMCDPDGVDGRRHSDCATQEVNFRTQAEPVPYKGSDANVYHVYPPGTNLTTVATAPNAYPGILAAYYECQVEDDWNKMCAVRVKPGDTIIVHAGTYSDDRYHYSGSLYDGPVTVFGSEYAGHTSTFPATAGQGTDFDGTYYLRGNGTKEKPIAIVSAGDGPVIIDGQNNHVLFDVQSANYNYFQGLVFQNTDVAILAGTKESVGSEGLTVKQCIFRNIAAGIWTEWAKSKWFYIVDNFFYGRNEQTYLSSWGGAPFSTLWTEHVANGTAETTPITVQPVAGGPTNDHNYATYQGPNIAYFATKLYGSAHTVAYNYAAYFHDGFDIDTHQPEGYPCDPRKPDCSPSGQPRDLMPVSLDTYNNDIYDMTDNCGEIDGSSVNARWLRNRCINTGEQATSNQPTFSGPQYLIRNVVYNSFVSSIKWDHAQGVLYLNNTFGEYASASPSGANITFLNNLIMQAPVSGTGVSTEVLSIGMYTNYSVLDYNGWGIPPGDGQNADGGPTAFSYASPADTTVLADYSAQYPDGGTPLVTHTYGTLAAYQAGTGQDKHSIVVDWTIFNNAPPPAQATNPEMLYSWGTTTAGVTAPVLIDYTLAKGSAAIDKGVFIPNVTDDFTGAAPDLGAYEYGQPVPIYGPRWVPIPGVNE